MKKTLIAILATLAVVSLGGCFPVFIPVGDGHHQGHGDGRHGDRDYRGDRGYYWGR